MPQTYFGPFGTQWKFHAKPAGGNCGNYPLGQQLILPDGRIFRYSLIGAVATVAGKVYQGALPVADHLETVVSTIPAVGDKTLASTLGATLAAIDIYSEGMAHTNKNTGLDYGYRIRRAIASGQAHAAVAASGVITVNLEPGETVQIAGISTTEVSYTRNRFHSVVIHDSPPTAVLAGVAPGIITAAYYGYLQTAGEAAVTTSGTLVIGDFCVPSATTDGTVMPSAAFETDGPYVGVVQRVNITAETSLIDLKLD